jgi:hypothetical protein
MLTLFVAMPLAWEPFVKWYAPEYCWPASWTLFHPLHQGWSYLAELREELVVAHFVSVAIVAGSRERFVVLRNESVNDWDLC